MLFRCIQCKADIIFGETAALVGRPGAVALDGHDCHAALVADRVAAIPIERPGCGRLIETAVRIGRFHCITVFGADAEDLRHKKRLVVVAPESGRLVILDERAFASTFAAAANLQRFRCFHNERLIISARPVS